MVYPSAYRRTPDTGQRITAGQLAELWRDLASADARRAFRAMQVLRASPKQAVAFLIERLAPTTLPAPKKLNRLIEALGDEQFEQRAGAMQALEELGDRAEPALRRALQANLPLESRRRIATLLQRLPRRSGKPAEQLRAIRSVAILEGIGTPQTMRALRSLARAAPVSWAALEAAATVQRHAKDRGADH